MSIWDLPLSQTARRFHEELHIDPDAFFGFYEHSRSQRILENLHFALSAEEYAALPCAERRSREELLMVTYVREDSPQKINITDQILRTVCDQLSTFSPLLFDWIELILMIFLLLLLRFIFTLVFAQMKSL